MAELKYRIPKPKAFCPCCNFLMRLYYIEDDKSVRWVARCWMCNGNGVVIEKEWPSMSIYQQTTVPLSRAKRVAMARSGRT